MRFSQVFTQRIRRASSQGTPTSQGAGHPMRWLHRVVYRFGQLRQATPTSQGAGKLTPLLTAPGWLAYPMRWLHTVAYRLRQVRQQLGFVAPLSAEDHAEVAHWLPPPAISLFQTMSAADQQHSLRVCRGLQARGCSEKDLLAAALLHDVGKGQGRVPFWTRPVIVIGKVCTAQLFARLTVYPYEGMSYPRWRRALSYAWYHADVGADLAAAAGLSERTVLYIRTHHQSHGPAAELHLVDEDS